MTLVAYDKINLNNRPLQDKITNIVMSIPFMPKTPRYLLSATIKAHTTVKKFFFDLSIASSSNELSQIIGSNGFDLAVKGPVDYTDSTNPTISLTTTSKELLINTLAKDHFVYFKIDTIPSFIKLMLTQIGYTEKIQMKFMNKWLYFGSTPMETEARKELKQKQTTKPLTEEFIDNFFSVLNEKQFSKAIKVENATVDEFRTYKVHFSPTDEILDSLFTNLSEKYYPQYKNISNSPFKISDIITDFTVDSWIDVNDYYMRKISISYSFKPASPMSPSMRSDYSSMTPFPAPLTKKTPVTMLLKLSDFGKEVIVKKPDNPQNIQDVFKSLSVEMASSSGSVIPGSQFQSADNTKRRSAVVQILNAVGAYAAENKGILPSEINRLGPGIITSVSSKTMPTICSKLVPNYIPALPTDPSLHVEDITPNKCAHKWDTGYKMTRDAINRVTVIAPLAENGEKISVTR